MIIFLPQNFSTEKCKLKNDLIWLKRVPNCSQLKFLPIESDEVEFYKFFVVAKPKKSNQLFIF